MSPASLAKWTPPGIIGVNEEAKTPEQVLDVPGLFKRIHQLQRAVGIDLTPIPTLEGSSGGGDEEEPPAQRIDNLEEVTSVLAENAAETNAAVDAAQQGIGALESRAQDLETALAAALARIAQLEAGLMSLTVGAPELGTPTLTINA